MNGWPARSAASRKPHPKHIHPGRGAFCAPAVFAAGEMRLNGSKGRGASTRPQQAELGGVASTLPPARAMTGQRGFAASEMRPKGSKRRVFAVGDPARRSRDRNGKTAVRGGEAMAAKRTTAQGGFAQRNAAPDFARQTQKAGPMFWPTTLSLRSSVAPRPKPRRLTFYRGML